MSRLSASRTARVSPANRRPRTRPRPSAGLRLLRLFALAGGVLLALGMLAIGLLMIAIYHQSRQDETAPAEAIVVLGAAHWNGSPSATFQARLDHALLLYQQGLAPTIVLTGGRAEGDQFTEAEVGRAYLARRGVPEEAMLTVGGRTSWQSIEQAGELLGGRQVERVLLVSDPFHMFRVKRMARDVGLEPLASPTRTSPIRESSLLEYRYMAREVAAYLAYVFLKT